jgi:hypothetical protein
VPADVQGVALAAVDTAEVQRPTCFGVHADALAAHRLERLVGVVVVPAVAAAAGQRGERDVVRRARLIQVLLLLIEVPHQRIVG